jgi:hypothetical protein
MPLHDLTIQGAVSALAEVFGMASLDLKLWFGVMCFLASMISYHESSIQQVQVDAAYIAGAEHDYVQCLKSQSDKPCGTGGVGPARIFYRNGAVGVIFRQRSSGS